MVNRAPQVHPPAGDPDDHLVEVPASAWAWAATAAASCELRPELQHPAPHCFVGDVESALGQQFLDITVAQGEPEIEPDRVLDDRRREAMSAVGELIYAGIRPSRAPARIPFR